MSEEAEEDKLEPEEYKDEEQEEGKLELPVIYKAVSSLTPEALGLSSLNESLRAFAASYVSELKDITGGLKVGVSSEIMDSIRSIAFQGEAYQEMLRGIASLAKSIRPMTENIVQLPDSGKRRIYPKIEQLSDSFDNVENKIDVVTPQIINDPSLDQDEKSSINQAYEEMKKEVAALHNKVAKLEREKYKIDPIQYPGSVSNFMAWMTKYIAIHGNRWVFSESSYEIRNLPAAKTSTREAWVITVMSHVDGVIITLDERWATILVVEEAPNKTTVEFIDGLYYYHDTRMVAEDMQGNTVRVFGGGFTEYDHGNPIGEHLLKIAEEIKAGFQGIEGNAQNGQLSPLWERIPNKKWYRKALQLWHEGLTAQQIEARINIPSRTIYNRLSEWRRKYGEEVVPNHR